MDLFQLGCFTLNSGKSSRWKIECDGLSTEEIDALAEMICHLVGFFSSVEGIPSGGTKLASRLQKSCIIPHEDHNPIPYPHLIVDDVLTTGRSMQRAKDFYVGNKVIGAVIFARGLCPDWVKPLFQMPKELWIK